MGRHRGSDLYLRVHQLVVPSRVEVLLTSTYPLPHIWDFHKRRLEIFCSLVHTLQDLLDSRNLISSKELHWVKWHILQPSFAMYFCVTRLSTFLACNVWTPFCLMTNICFKILTDDAYFISFHLDAFVLEGKKGNIKQKKIGFSH